MDSLETLPYIDSKHLILSKFTSEGVRYGGVNFQRMIPNILFKSNSYIFSSQFNNIFIIQGVRKRKPLRGFLRALNVRMRRKDEL
jgi:hypothetical protein